MRLLSSLFVVFLFSQLATIAHAEQGFVVKDGTTELDYDEFAYKVDKWTPQMREVALVDPGDRLELINLVVANKKIAEFAEEYVKDKPGLYLDYINGMQGYQRDFVLKHYAANLEYPDFAKLAEEQYKLNPDKYALVPEKRTSSHILFRAPPGMPRDEITVKAQEVLDQLRAGADFVEMVELHSGEPNAAAKKGKFDRWITFGEVGVSPPYSEGLFTIGKVGEYSELVNTEFGIHIIRLDGIQEKYYQSFEEVKPKIAKELENEYRRLAMKEFVSGFQISDDVIIDDAAVQKILEAYSEN